MKALIESYRNGEHLSNTDLDKLIDHYSTLTSLLKQHGERTRIHWYYFYTDLENLLSYKERRQWHKQSNNWKLETIR